MFLYFMIHKIFNFVLASSYRKFVSIYIWNNWSGIKIYNKSIYVPVMQVDQNQTWMLRTIRWNYVLPSDWFRGLFDIIRNYQLGNYDVQAFT